MQIYWSAARRHPVVSGGLLLVLAGVMHLAQRHEEGPKALAYLAAMLGGAVLVDLFALRFPATHELPVRRPRHETLWVLGIELAALLTLALQYMVLDWANLSFAARLALLPTVLVIFPVLLPVLLWRQGYRPGELGFRWHAACWVFLPVLCLTAGTALLVAPEEATFARLLATEGVVGALITGIIASGLAEEFVRMALQTRLGAHLRNPAAGWLLATVIWAFLHSPKWYGEGRDLYEAVMGAVRIIPLGLLWGYMTHRTRSLVPATLAHGFNVWGLQNF